MILSAALLVLAAALLQALFAALLLALLSVAGYGLVPKRLLPARAGLRLAVSLSAGTALFGMAGTVAGSLLGTRWVPAAFALLVAASLPGARGWPRDLLRAFRRGRALVLCSPFSSCLLALPLSLALAALALPLSDSDGLRYHVAFPKLWLLGGKISFYPWDITGGFPQQAETLYLLALPLAGGESAKFLHFGFFVALLALVGSAVHRGRGRRGAALLAPFLLAAAPVALVPAASAFVDHVALFHLAVGAVLLGSRGAPALVGLAAGAAFAVTLTAGPGAAGLVLATAAAARTGSRLRTLGLALLISAIPFAPYAVRNLVHTGDPLYPAGTYFAGRPLPGVARDRASTMTEFNAGQGGVLGILWSSRPGETRSDEVAGWHLLAALAVLPLALRRPLRPLLAIALPFVLLALLVHPPTRFFLPLLAALAFLEAVVLCRLLPRLAPAAAAVAAIPAFLTAVSSVGSLHPLPYLLGETDRERFLTERVPGYRAAVAVNSLGKGPVMALDFPALFYLDRPFIAEGIIHDPPLKGWIDEARSADDVLRRLRALGVEHILVTPGYGGGTAASLLPLASDAARGRIVLDLRKSLRLVGRVDQVDIYEVPRSSGGGKPPDPDLSSPR